MASDRFEAWLKTQAAKSEDNAGLASGGESERLAALHELGILDTPPESDFDDLTKLASYICGAPIALVSLVDADRQWSKSKIGLDVDEAPREHSFCTRAIETPDQPFIVPDATADERFKENPLVTGDPYLRAYAGVPLQTEDGLSVGTVCVIDRVPRSFDAEQIHALKLIAKEVEEKLEQRVLLKKVSDIATQTHRELQESDERFSVLVQAVTDYALYSLDPRGNVVSWNAGAERIHGYSATEVLGRHFSMFYPPEAVRVGEPAEEMRRAAFEGRFEHEGRRVRKDGSLFWVDSVITPIRGEGQDLQGFANVTRDISERKHAQEELRAAFEEIVFRLSSAAEFRDEATGRHIERVGRYSELLATRLGLGEERCQLIRYASPLHDVGKIGIPDSVLQKPGKLMPEEMEMMQRHAEIGHSLLAGSAAALLQNAATIALTHHEKWDGTGYPQGLSGHAIPIEGRIVAVADVFDALTTDRVYRPAMEIEEAIAFMSENSGTHFDPELLDLFIDSLDDVLAIRKDALDR